MNAKQFQLFMQQWKEISNTHFQRVTIRTHTEST